MTPWERIEYETTQRLLGALVGKYGARLSEETKEQAAVLATVALAAIRGQYEEMQRIITEQHGKLWLVGLDTHEGEEPQPRDESHRNLDRLLDAE